MYNVHYALFQTNFFIFHIWLQHTMLRY